MLKYKFNKKDTLPAKEHNDCKQNDYKSKQLHVIFFCARDKSFKLLTHGDRPFQHCRNTFNLSNKQKVKITPLF